MIYCGCLKTLALESGACQYFVEPCALTEFPTAIWARCSTETCVFVYLLLVKRSRWDVNLSTPRCGRLAPGPLRDGERRRRHEPRAGASRDVEPRLLRLLTRGEAKRGAKPAGPPHRPRFPTRHPVGSTARRAERGRRHLRAGPGGALGRRPGRVVSCGAEPRRARPAPR